MIFLHSILHRERYTHAYTPLFIIWFQLHRVPFHVLICLYRKMAEPSSLTELTPVDGSLLNFSLEVEVDQTGIGQVTSTPLKLHQSASLANMSSESSDSESNTDADDVVSLENPSALTTSNPPDQVPTTSQWFCTSLHVVCTSHQILGGRLQYALLCLHISFQYKCSSNT